jgi:bacteriorhodopsin
MLAVTIYQGDWTWVVLCVVVLGFFVYWLAVGQARRSATLQRAIDANNELISEPAPARARRKR